jgi:hypothetical protein
MSIEMNEEDSEMGILTVYKPKSVLYTSRTRNVPGPSCSKTKDFHFHRFLCSWEREGEECILGQTGTHNQC